MAREYTICGAFPHAPGRGRPTSNCQNDSLQSEVRCHVPGPTALRAFINDRNLVETFLNCYRPFDGHIILAFQAVTTKGVASYQDKTDCHRANLVCMTCHVKSAGLGLRHG